ncbi:unnamed protein product, partial [Cyprideis torosa]
MPPIPTVGHGAGSSADRENRRPQRPGEQRRSELICKVKYFNTLPDIPFDCKFLAYPFDPNRFVNYVPTSLERSHRWDLLVEPDLGMRIDLVNPETYSDTGSGMLDPADEKLLEEDALVPTDSKRSRHHAKAVSWLRRTEYISTEHTRFQPSQIEKVEAKVGYNIKKNFQEEALFSMDRESQIKAIEKTFSSAKKEILRHPTKKNVTATEVLPVLPDFSSWKYPWAQVIFDADPCPPDVPQRVERDEYIASALLRGVVDPEGEQFVAFFLPTQETIDKRLEDAEAGVAYDDEKEYEYVMSREYNWNVKNKSHSSFDQNYFFIVGPEGVWYNELETRVRLMRRRRKKDQPVRTRLLVTHRPISEDEHRLMALREKALEALEEEEEDEELEQADNKDGGELTLGKALKNFPVCFTSNNNEKLLNVRSLEEPKAEENLLGQDQAEVPELPPSEALQDLTALDQGQSPAPGHRHPGQRKDLQGHQAPLPARRPDRLDRRRSRGNLRSGRSPRPQLKPESHDPALDLELLNRRAAGLVVVPVLREAAAAVQRFTLRLITVHGDESSGERSTCSPEDNQRLAPRKDPRTPKDEETQP